MTSSSDAGAAVSRSDSTGRWVWIETPQLPLAMPAEVGQELDNHRPVQSEDPARPGDLGSRRVRAGPCRRRITGHQVRDSERHHDDAHDHHHRQRDPAARR